ncbi:hypothetical protein SprV_0200581000 [Sparganum proliferum]
MTREQIYSFRPKRRPNCLSCLTSEQPNPRTHPGRARAHFTQPVTGVSQCSTHTTCKMTTAAAAAATTTSAKTTETTETSIPTDSEAAEHVANRFNLDLHELDKFTFREARSDTQSSVVLLGQRVHRQYMSEFVLPDDTRVAVRRVESSYPSDHMQTVVVCLAVGHPQDALYTPSEVGSTTTLNYSGGLPSDMTDTDEGADGSCIDRGGQRPCGLQIADYLEDDLWAATILECDSATNGELLRQLETGCRLDPDAFRMERLQRRRNWRTVVDMPKETQTRNLGFTRTAADSDSTLTETTSVD